MFKNNFLGQEWTSSSFKAWTVCFKGFHLNALTFLHYQSHPDMQTSITVTIPPYPLPGKPGSVVVLSLDWYFMLPFSDASQKSILPGNNRQSSTQNTKKRISPVDNCHSSTRRHTSWLKTKWKAWMGCKHQAILRLSGHKMLQTNMLQTRKDVAPKCKSKFWEGLPPGWDCYMQSDGQRPILPHHTGN